MFQAMLPSSSSRNVTRCVDRQRGEAEWTGGNLYFDQWHYDFVATLKP